MKVASSNLAAPTLTGGRPDARSLRAERRIFLPTHARLAVTGPGPTPGSPSVPWGPGAGWGLPSNAPGSPEIRSRELAAIRALRFAAILGIAGLVLGVVVPYAIALSEGSQSPFSTFALVTSSTSGNNTTITVNSGALWSLLGLVVAGSAIGFVGLVLYRRCFVGLRSFDRDFASPASLTVLLLIGLVLLVAAVASLLATLVGLSGCVLGGPSPPACATSLFDTLLAEAGIILVALILVIVGLIGLLLGIWRVGTRYNSTLLHVAAILYIIPIASVIAPILTLVEARAIERRLASGTAGPGSGLLPPPGFPAPPLPPSSTR